MDNEKSAALHVVAAWQEAVNEQDSARLVALSAPEIEVAGPRGSGFGHQLLKEWLGRAGLRLTTLRTFARGDVVVLEQQAEWRASGTGEVTGNTILAAAFRVDAQLRVARFARYDTLGEALEAAGLDETDEIHQGERRG